ncbi:Beta-ketoadipate enol-lactone hydrolase [Minicystis rosea]|nr:Beta-ketoadipate enol-lactone hydrolase [Minicystis rosea]
MQLQAFDGLIDLPRGAVRVRVRGEGPPLIWSHGVFFPLDVDDESTLGRVLGDVSGFTVIRWDARGHGRSPAAATADEHRWDRLGDDVLALADALGIERFAAGGISMGAAVTLHAAVKAPQRIEAMMLLAMPTAWETRPAEQERYRELLAFGSPEALAAHVQEDLDAVFPPGTLPASLRAMVAHLRAQEWMALERVIAGASQSDMPSKDVLAALRVPALLRPWPNDSGHPMSTAEALFATLPEADMVLLGGFDDEIGIRGALSDLHGRCAPRARPD